jgi:hypothetical protein
MTEINNILFENQQRSQNIRVFSDIYSSVKSLKQDFEKDLQNSISGAASKDGKVTLSNGMEIDMTTSAGMSAFSMYMSRLNSMMSFVDGTFDYVKKFEQHLQTLVTN